MSDLNIIFQLYFNNLYEGINTLLYLIIIYLFLVKYERIKFLVIALKESVEIYAWAPKPYHKFMAFKSFSDLLHKPLLVDLTVEENIRLKVIFGSAEGFHAVDLDSGAVYDVYLPAHVRMLYFFFNPLCFSHVTLLFI